MCRYAGIYYVIGKIHYKNENAAEAIEALEKVKTMDPDFADTNIILDALYR